MNFLLLFLILIVVSLFLLRLPLVVIYEKRRDELFGRLAKKYNFQFSSSYGKVDWKLIIPDENFSLRILTGIIHGKNISIEDSMRLMVTTGFAWYSLYFVLPTRGIGAKTRIVVDNAQTDLYNSSFWSLTSFASENQIISAIESR